MKLLQIHWLLISIVFSISVQAQSKYPKLEDVTFTVMTGSSFDFFGKPRFTDYIGEFSLQMPGLFPLKKGSKSTFGINTGIFNLNYFTKDTANGRIYRDYVLIDPIPVTDSSRFASRVYRLKSKTEYDRWGFYLQPFVRVFEQKNDDKAQFTLDIPFHMEVLTINASTTYEIDYITNDTFVANPTDSLIYRLSGDRMPRSNRQVNGYFGTGLIFNIKYKDAFDFSLHGITGITTSNPHKEAQLENTSPTQSLRTENVVHDPGGFYLVKAKVTEKYTKLNACIGIEIRGLFPSYAPQIAPYLGFNIKLEEFFKN